MSAEETLKQTYQSLCAKLGDAYCARERAQDSIADLIKQIDSLNGSAAICKDMEARLQAKYAEPQFKADASGN